MAQFKEFGKIARYNRDITITEKIDGTNAAIIIEENILNIPEFTGTLGRTTDGKYYVDAQSRNRILTPGKGTDNFGFAQWVEDNKDALSLLGPGHHYGEWYGAGIQRTYGLTHRRFALFNTDRWGRDPEQSKIFRQVQERVSNIYLVPVLYSGPRLSNAALTFCADPVTYWLDKLAKEGSVAVPGFMEAEGVVIYHSASRQLYKATVKNDEAHKGTFPGMHNQKEEHEQA